MKAVIVSGGKGTRLNQITGDLIPKCLVPLAGKTVITHQLERLAQNGIYDVTMCIGHMGDHVRDFVGDKLNYIEEKVPLGTAGAMYYLRGKMTEDFFVVFGDIIFDIDISKMFAFHRKNKAILTLYAQSNSHPEDSDLVIADHDGRVRQILKKTDKRPEKFHNFVNSSIFIVSPRALENIKAPEPMDFEGDFIRGLISKGEAVFAYTQKGGFVEDMGTPDRLKTVEKYLLKQELKPKTREHLEVFFKRYPALTNLEQQIIDVVQTIISVAQTEKTILICGNGGSAADSEHMAGELLKSFMLKREIDANSRKELIQKFGEVGQRISDKLQKGIRVIPMASFQSFNTAFANDCAPEMSFAQLANVFGERGNVLICFSTSGNSINVLHAAMVAQAKGMRVISFTGQGGGKLKALSNILLETPSTITHQIQEYHLPLYHVICLMTESEYFEN